jgi:hypothetical protein
MSATHRDAVITVIRGRSANQQQHYRLDQGKAIGTTRWRPLLASRRSPF